MYSWLSVFSFWPCCSGGADSKRGWGVELRSQQCRKSCPYLPGYFHATSLVWPKQQRAATTALNISSYHGEGKVKKTLLVDHSGQSWLYVKNARRVQRCKFTFLLPIRSKLPPCSENPMRPKILNTKKLRARSSFFTFVIQRAKRG